MWEKLDIFGWSKKKSSIQPVQREVSITLTNGDRQETIQRSPSGTKLASSASAKHGLDDDDSSDGSTSLNFGPKVTSSPRRSSSFSFSREPLDPSTWSNVTSPGFTSRLVQQASGNNTLKEFNDSMSFSPFRKSPHRCLQLGELPHVSFSRKPKISPPSFPTPSKSLRSGVSSSVYSRDRRRHARQGTVFVRIAPIDPTTKANISLSGKSPSQPVGLGNNTSPFPPRGSPRSNEAGYRSEGLGGIPQELAMRFNRMWTPASGSPIPNRPSSPTSPSNIVEALTAGRKRGRESEAYFQGSSVPSQVSSPSKISVGIGDTPVRPQISKRVKFLGGPEGHDRPMMVSYSAMGGGDSEPLSSESILEQMNQTEKRFLPDSTTAPYSIQKKSARPGTSAMDEQASTLQSALRKRRSQSNIMSAADEESRGEKAGRFCRCNECYAEAAGVSSFIQPQTGQIRDGSTSPGSSVSKSTNTGEVKERETCDKGVGVSEFDKVAYFKELFKKPVKKPVQLDKDELMKEGKILLTKEMYDKDKKKRVERYYRLLKLKPPGGSIFDVTDDSKSAGTSTIDITDARASAPLSSTCSSAAFVTSGQNFFGIGASKDNSTETTTATSTSSNGNSVPAFGIAGQNGLGSTTTSATVNNFAFNSPGGEFSFGKQTSPVAPTITTNACSTISSSSSTGSSFGLNSISNTSAAPTTSAVVSTLFSGSSVGTTPITFEVPSSTSSSLGSTGNIDGAVSPFGIGANNMKEMNTTNPASTHSNNVLTFGIPGQTGLGSTTTNADGSTFGSSVGGFSFGKQTPPVAPTITTNACSTISSPSSTGSNFGLNSMSNPAATSAPAAVVNTSFGGTSVGATPITFEVPSSTSSSLGSTGNANGAVSPFGTGASKDNTTDPTSTTTTNSNNVITFGTPGSQGLGNTTTTASSFSFGGSSVGGFSFGKQSSPAEPILTTNASSTISLPPSTGSNFGVSASPLPTTLGNTAFGGSGVSTAPIALETPASVTSPLGSTGNASGAGSSFRGVSFNVPNPLAKPKPVEPSPSAVTSTASTTNSNSIWKPTPTGGFNFSTGSQATGLAPFGGSSTTPSVTSANATPTFGGFGASSTPAATAIVTPTFGGFGSSSTPSATAIATPAFGGFGSSGTPSVTATATPAFGGFGSAAAPSNTTNATPAFGGFGSSTTSTATASATPAFGGFGSAAAPSNTTNATPTFGGFGSSSTSSVATSSASTFGFGSSASTNASVFGGKTTTGANTTTAASAQPPTFGSLASTSGTAFGGSSTSNPGFSFGSSSMSPPQAQPSTGGFAFGSNSMSPPQAQPSTGGFAFGGTAPQQQQPAPALPSSGGFSFGQSSAPPALPAAAPNVGAGVFQFGQQANTSGTGGGGATPFQFGQQAAQGVPTGGFNFAAGAPVANQMFSVGSASTAPRRRDARRRHR